VHRYEFRVVPLQHFEEALEGRDFFLSVIFRRVAFTIAPKTTSRKSGNSNTRHTSLFPRLRVKPSSETVFQKVHDGLTINLGLEVDVQINLSPYTYPNWNTQNGL
jgi:hypothetical protein